MFLLTVGDDVSKRTVPFAALVLIGLNLLAASYDWHVGRTGTTVAEGDGAAGSPDSSVVPEMDVDIDDIIARGTPRFAVEDGIVHLQPVSAATPVAQSQVDGLSRRWGLVPTDLEQGRYIGLITHLFLHSNASHLLGNLLTLWLFLPTIASALGARRFLLFYLAWGMAAGLAHAATNWGSWVPMIGASGAVSGIIGAYFVTYGPYSHIHCVLYASMISKEPIRLRIPAGMYVMSWLVIPNMLGLTETHEVGMGATAWFAHAGGFFAGMITMPLFARDAARKLSGVKEPVMSASLTRRRTDAPPPPAMPIMVPASVELTPQHISQPTQSPPTSVVLQTDTCPYCHTPLSADSMLDDTLFRCVSPSCARLVLAASQVSAKAG